MTPRYHLQWLSYLSQQQFSKRSQECSETKDNPSLVEHDKQTGERVRKNAGSIRKYCDENPMEYLVCAYHGADQRHLYSSRRREIQERVVTHPVPSALATSVYPQAMQVKEFGSPLIEFIGQR